MNGVNRSLAYILFDDGSMSAAEFSKHLDIIFQSAQEGQTKKEEVCSECHLKHE
jgi:hypothetical protein